MNAQNLVDQTCELLKWLCNQLWKLHNTTIREQFWQYTLRLLLLTNHSSNVAKWSLRGKTIYRECNNIQSHKRATAWWRWEQYSFTVTKRVYYLFSVVKCSRKAIPDRRTSYSEWPVTEGDVAEWYDTDRSPCYLKVCHLELATCRQWSPR